MSYLLPHLDSGWEVDQAILSEEERLVVLRFGHDWYIYKYILKGIHNACKWTKYCTKQLKRLKSLQ